MGGKIKIRDLLVSVLACGVFITFPLWNCSGQMINQPGVVSPGKHYFPAIHQVFPADALSGGMRPLRKVIPWEKGELIWVYTDIYHFEDGRRRGSVGLQPSGISGLAQANLRPGVYEVVVVTHTQEWQWVDRPPFENFRGHYLVKEIQHSSFETRSYFLEVIGQEEKPHPCDGNEHREGVQTPDAELLREAIANALASHGARIGPEHVIINSPHRPASQPGFDMLTFTIPLQRTDNQPRHNMICLMEKMYAGEIQPGTLIGAGEMLFGMVQEIGGKTRFTMRRTEVETGTVLDAGMSTVEGTGVEALNQAVSEATADAVSGLQFR